MNHYSKKFRENAFIYKKKTKKLGLYESKYLNNFNFKKGKQGSRKLKTKRDFYFKNSPTYPHR